MNMMKLSLYLIAILLTGCRAHVEWVAKTTPAGQAKSGVIHYAHYSESGRVEAIQQATDWCAPSKIIITQEFRPVGNEPVSMIGFAGPQGGAIIPRGGRNGVPSPLMYIVFNCSP